jgi:hypothetical protein
MAGGRVKEVHASGDVGGIEDAGFADGLGDEGFSGKVHDGIDLVLGEDGFKLRAICQVGQAKDCAGRDGGAVAFEQTIQSDDAHAAREQNFGADAADVACGSSNENIHFAIS